MTALNLDNQ